MDILKAATWNGRTPSAEPTSSAAWSLASSPTSSFSVLDNVRQVHRVVKGGVIYDPEQLLKPLVGTVE